MGPTHIFLGSDWENSSSNKTRAYKLDPNRLVAYEGLGWVGMSPSYRYDIVHFEPKLS